MALQAFLVSFLGVFENFEERLTSVLVKSKGKKLCQKLRCILLLGRVVIDKIALYRWSALQIYIRGI